jgi:transcriptional regulator with XRE-family HTH domain
MGPKDALRDRVQRLLSVGISQKTLAAEMGISRTAFNRWVHGDDIRVSIDALDRFEAFVAKVAAALGQETERAPAAAAGESFRPGDRRRENRGPQGGLPERRTGT